MTLDETLQLCSETVTDDYGEFIELYMNDLWDRDPKELEQLYSIWHVSVMSYDAGFDKGVSTVIDDLFDDWSTDL